MKLLRLTPVVLSLAFVVATISLQATENSKPNILLMLADDLGSGDLSCYGSPETKTPVLDQLAQDGIRFDDFYAACGVCSPSRAALLTGRFSVRAGVYSWVHDSQHMHLRVEETTIAELMKQAGYSTAHVGKWHLGYDLVKGSGPGPNPGDHGFDYWLATGNNATPSHRNPNNFVRNGVALGEVPGYSCQLVADEAITWLDDHRDKSKPFFLNVWFHEPHAKVASPEDLANRHKGVRNPQYYGCIENMDLAVGRLLAKLDAMKVSDNTVVIFTSDNGSYMTDRLNNRGFTGRKTQLWEGGIREPGMIRWPGKIKPGTVSDQPAGLVDILPTLCEVVGISAPQDRTLDGVSLVSHITGGKLNREKPLYWFYNPSRPVCVIRNGDWCLIADPELELSRNNMFLEEYIGPIKETKLIYLRLYNLRKDPKQETDLSKDQAEIFQKMKKQMFDLHADVMQEAFDWRTVK
ncbi:MAG: sulfatase-like hydrolase/transferase [Pirellulales bacterium]